MKHMPESLVNKLILYNRSNHLARQIHEEIVRELEEHEVPYDNLVANQQNEYEPSTEALAFINNCEGYIDENIKEIEEVFLYFVNRKGSDK